jgi:hypothetical protein
MGLIPEGASGAIQSYADKAIKKAVNYGSQYLNSKINYGLAYAENFIRQYDVFGVLPDQWSIIDESGEKAFTFDSFVSADIKSESKVIQSPVEQGSFASYNLTVTPCELSCTLSKKGYQSDLMAFVDSLQNYIDSTDLLTVVTPEREYSNMKLIKFNFTRNAENGIDIIFAELGFIEVREVTSEYTSVRIARRAQRGVQQGKETSALAGMASGIKGLLS